MAIIKNPTYKEERLLELAGYQTIVGVDEVGCGALAGPVMAGSVVLNIGTRLPLVRDSKLLSAKQRDEVFEEICVKARAWAVGEASVEEITMLGIRPATYLAMTRAINKISLQIDHVLVDAWTIPGIKIQQKGIIRGDRLVKSIAAASIVAKVTRDRYMAKLDVLYPGYDFALHKGYGTEKHRENLLAKGLSPEHRSTYSMGLENMIKNRPKISLK